MCGTFRKGDVLLVAPAALNAVRPGDVVAFRRPRQSAGPALIAHRVRGHTDAGLITCADASAIADPEPVLPRELVGCVRFVRRGGLTRPVWGGRAGQLWVGLLRLRRSLARVGRRPYQLLHASGLARRLWRPHVRRVHLTTEAGPLVKYVHRRRTVAEWHPEEGRFWCRKPFDLVIEPPDRPQDATAR
jgi:hypothetical protein